MPRPWGWEQARAKRFDDGLDDVMSAAGRSRSVSGNYRSRPGALMSPTDTMRGLTGMGRPITGGKTDETDWNRLFKPSQTDTAQRFGYNANTPMPGPSLAPTVPTDARAMAETWSSLSKPADYLRAAVGVASKFSQDILGGAPAPAGLRFSGLKYQTPGTEGRVESVTDLRRKPGSRWFGTA